MRDQCIHQTDLPAAALAADIVERHRALCPAYREFVEFDLVFSAMLAHIVMDTDNDLHILTDGVLLIAAHLDDGLLAEQSESARDDEQGVGRAPEYTSHQK